MVNWRTRLLEAVDNDGRSDRAISKAAGLGPNFVNELRRGQKSPSVDNVIALIRQLGLSETYVFSGFELSGEDEELMRVFLALSPSNREALLVLARQLSVPTPA